MKDFQFIDYWFYLESYVFIFKEKRKFVVYNTMNSAYIDCSIYKSTQKILSELYDSNKNYCVGISKSLLNDSSFLIFLTEIRKSFSGDIIDNRGQAPFIFKPILRIYFHPAKSKIKEDNLLGINSLLYLHEVSFFLAASDKKLKKEYHHCYKQFLHPIKTDSQIMTFHHYENIIKQLAICQLDKINIVTDKIHNNDLLIELLESTDKFKLKTEIVSLFDENIDINNVGCLKLNSRLTLKIIVHLPIDLKKLEFQINLLSCFNIIWVCIVTKEKDLECIDSIIESFSDKIELCPWYDGSNREFFKRFVFNELEDIITIPISKQKIFRRQVLNENFFGKLTVLPNGDVYTNTNFHSIGNILHQKLTEIVYSEISNVKNSWFFTRETGICNECINKYLCPSISNYEIVMNEYNMCYLNK